MKKKNYCLLLLLSVFPLLLKSQFLAADINKSLVGSDPSFVRAGIEYFVFTALSDQYGRELFVSDGTEAGTKLVKDIRIGTQGSLPPSFKSFNNTLYFLAQDGAVGTELWKSDGTAQGTQLVKDIFTGPDSAFGNNRLQSTSDGIHFFFVAKDSLQGWALWRSDGTLT